MILSFIQQTCNIIFILLLFAVPSCVILMLIAGPLNIFLYNNKKLYDKYFQWAIRVAMIIMTLFFVSIKYNSHCTQKVSYYIVLFDMKQHVEDNPGDYPDSGVFPIYKTGSATPLRIAFAIQYPLFLLIPFIMSFIRITKQNRTKVALFQIMALIICLLFSGAWQLYGGERAGGLFISTVFTAFFGFFLSWGASIYIALADNDRQIST